MKRTRGGLVAVATAAAVFAATAGVANAAHFIGNDSVDGSKIAYEDYTRYDTALNEAISSWSKYGRVSIVKDTAGTITDLQIGDFLDTQPGAPWGYWQPRPGADAMQLNTWSARMETTDGGSTKRRRTMTHEMGHALGIGDHTSSPYSTTLMYGYMTSNGVPSYPAAHDGDDYRSLWG